MRRLETAKALAPSIALLFLASAALPQDGKRGKEVVLTKDAPNPAGPYSQAIKADSFSLRARSHAIPRPTRSSRATSRRRRSAC